MKEIQLTKGEVALVDDEDFERVNKLNWNITSNNERVSYARCSNRTAIKMHTFITGYKMTDHKDGNGLNNQRHNLRECTPAQNMMNRSKQAHRCGKSTTSKYKGVHWNINKWKVKLIISGKNINGGRFTNEDEAALKYNELALLHFGEFAKLNKITI